MLDVEAMCLEREHMDSHWQEFLQDNIQRYEDEEKLEAEYKELVLEDNILNDSEIASRLIKRHEIYVSRYLNLEEEMVNSMSIMEDKFTLAERKSLTLLLNYIADTQKAVINQR